MKYNSAPQSVPMHRAHHVRDLGAKGDGAVTKNFASLFTVRNQNKDTNEVDTKPVGYSNQSLMNFVEGDENVPNIYLILL